MLNTYSASSVMSVSRVNTNDRPAITSSVVSGEAITVRVILGQRRSSVAGLTEDDRQTVDKERQVGDPMQLRTEVLNL